MPQFCLELARVTGRPRDTGTSQIGTWLDEFGEAPVNTLLLTSTMELEDLERLNPEFCAFLDIEAVQQLRIDANNVQFFRLSAAYSGRPSWKVIKYRWLLAKVSEAFYSGLATEKQWLRTVIRPRKKKPGAIEIHSNVVGGQAYLTRLEDHVRRDCPGLDLCMKGFVPTGVLLGDAEPLPSCHSPMQRWMQWFACLSVGHGLLGDAEPLAHPHCRTRQCCASCPLLNQLRGGADHTNSEPELLEFLNENAFEPAVGYASLTPGAQAAVERIIWCKGIFVRKRFDSSQINYFIRELSVAGKVLHPNIVHYFGFVFSSDEAAFDVLCMEMLEGDLETLLVDLYRSSIGRPSFRDLLEVLLQIANAMRHLHERNFLHGDLKPGNIFVSRLPMPHSDAQFNLVKVADFGCAQEVDSISGATVQPFDYKIGTLEYTAPEVLRCRKDKKLYPLRHPLKIDVYSFGVVAYKVITGFREVYADLSHYTERIINGTLRPDHNLGNLPALDADRSSFLPFVRACWDPNPDKRPSFEEICAMLRGRIEHYA